MTTYKLLSLDESGKASYTHLSELFILSGVIIPEKFKIKLDSKMRKLKKKFFSDEELVFHSRDMSRRKGPFAILQDSKKEIAFWSEFISLANNSNIAVSFIIVNKQIAKQKGWHQKTILKRTYLKMLECFASRQLGKDEKGKIITESDPSQDLYLIQAHNIIQGTGTRGSSISAEVYRQKITSLCLVKKSNLDVDVQMADALAPIAGMIYRTIILKKQKSINKIENMKKRLIDRKLKDKSNPSVFEILL